ncbi:hypothetical protein LHJ74_12595 [Streptomyces sp. N2-109]|uniref:DNA-binding protein n=1 Tax=Streptomyces gossypii TaxID=2883101 RepID=A0ABT2JS91_9ACTN|nr:hypothetical protein [Streptomyces gossypii]MCT2590738.1 hypothetical protein [Streptomyces gossypii]
MLRHVIAPAHAFAQIPNAILRHPRLSPDAKTLLNWQLSLPSEEKQCLSGTAHKAGIKKVAFQKAKRQLREEGYLHEWTTRGARGHFLTVQLVSNTPLSANEALAVRDGLLPAPGGARLTTAADAQPSAVRRAARQRTDRPVGRLPEKNIWENTTQPTAPAAEEADEPGTLAAAETLLFSLAKVDPDLALPLRTARNWAPLAAKWLESGLSRPQVRHALTEGLTSARKPLGALRWRLEHALPEPPPPLQLSPAMPKPQPRITGMRECRTRHTQPRLFRPEQGGDQDLCPDCRTAQDRTTAHAPQPREHTGLAAFRDARERKRKRLRPAT